MSQYMIREDQRDPHHTGQRLLETVQHCEATCERTQSIITRQYSNRWAQLQHLRDCADTCALMVKLLARNSRFAKQFAHTCARICQECGNECLRHRDQLSQHCGKICLNCARDCYQFATAS